MRAITEEKLRKERSVLYEMDKYHPFLVIFDALIKECQEIDQLTVSKLRPMSDGHQEMKVLAMFQGELIITNYLGDGYWRDGDDFKHKEDLFDGWIPLPIYKPSQP